jgi:hypothetical protein
MYHDPNPAGQVSQFAQARVLAQQIRSDFEAFERTGRECIEKALSVGSNLLKLKRTLGHGHFERYVDENLPFQSRQAQKYMRLAKAHSECALLMAQ